MYANIKVITNSGKDEIQVKKNGELLVKVTASPEKGKANKKVLKLLAEYYNVPKSSILIVKGKFNSKKVINIVKQ